MIPRLNRVLLCWTLIFELAVLPFGRVYAQGGPGPTPEQIATLFEQAFDSLGRSGWRSFDLNSGAELATDASVDRLQSATPDESAHIGIVKSGVSFLVDIVTSSSGTITIKTYPLKHKPDLGHMTTRDINPLLKSAHYRGQLDLSSVKSATELANEIHKISGDVEESMVKNIGTSGLHVGLKIGIASALIIIFSAAILEKKKPGSLRKIVTSVEIFGASLGIVKNSTQPTRKVVPAGKPICPELLK
jgi:hypothetical protein